MEFRVTSDPAEFQAIAFPFLEADPVLHTVIMSNVAERAAGRYVQEDDPAYYVSVHDAGEVIGAAMRTPNRPVHLGALSAELAEPIADVYLEVVPEATAVAGDRPAATAFAKRWIDARGGNMTEGRASRLHKLGPLTPLTAEGSPRLMTSDEVRLVAEWSADGFHDEFTGPDLEWGANQFRGGRMWIWEADSKPVSMVSYHEALFGVCRVGPVYTPREHRRNGYAGALTAHVSALILADGNQACLYTDLANPTSNKIYHQLGYRPVADFIDLAFTG